jgi:molybdopterin converting factor small subunit
MRTEANAAARILREWNNMSICVEFFGVARQRAGTATVVMPFEGTATVGIFLARLAVKFPQWATECLDGDHLRPSYIINVDGNRFVRDLQEPLSDETSLLIMPADAGG